MKHRGRRFKSKKRVTSRWKCADGSVIDPLCLCRAIQTKLQQTKHEGVKERDSMAATLRDQLLERDGMAAALRDQQQELQKKDRDLALQDERIRQQQKQAEQERNRAELMSRGFEQKELERQLAMLQIDNNQKLLDEIRRDREEKSKQMAVWRSADDCCGHRDSKWEKQRDSKRQDQQALQTEIETVTDRETNRDKDRCRCS